MNNGFLPCGCGSVDLDVDCTGAAEIAGVSYWSAWVECKACKNYLEWEIVEGNDETNWSEMRKSWNSVNRFQRRLHSISEPSGHTLTELFDDGERFVQYHCKECERQVWFDMERGCEISNEGVKS
jgi:hypothetical protein